MKVSVHKYPRLPTTYTPPSKTWHPSIRFLSYYYTIWRAPLAPDLRMHMYTRFCEKMGHEFFWLLYAWNLFLGDSRINKTY